MPITRRKFIEDTIKTFVVIGAGNMLQSFSSKAFVLPAKERIRLRFAIASDGHYGQAQTDYPKFHADIVNWLNREKRNRGVHFTVMNGDLVHDDVSHFPALKAVYDQLKMPYYVSHGNHDKCDAATWEKSWNMPLHHAFEKKDAAFLILDTADPQGKYVCPDLEWTRTQLDRFRSKKQLFVFMHITPLKWTANGIACPELVSLFDRQTNLKAVFHGHDHDQDNVKENNGKHYFFDSHIGGNWGTSYRGYRMVEVLKSGEIITYQVNPATEMPVNRTLIQTVDG
jgi:3',5'-cyclic-AMP phosphodiesterase